jgi:TPR repeat protein
MGIGIPKDIEMAKEYYLLAVSQGNPAARIFYSNLLKKSGG